MKMAVICAHAGAATLSEAILSWGETVTVMNGSKGILPAYQEAYAGSEGFDVLAYLHDDLIIHDQDWTARVLKEFEDPLVGLVGFGGALWHGSPDLYKAPYDYHQLGRSEFMSNMDDAENHGARFTGSREVAVLDGFALIVRTELLDHTGGWPVETLGYIGYDYWASAMAHRYGYRIKLVGCAVRHIGGQTFVKLGLGRGPEHWAQYLAAHEYIYSEFKDVLPFRVETK